jgi:hypothetical protein
MKGAQGAQGAHVDQFSRDEGGRAGTGACPYGVVVARGGRRRANYFARLDGVTQSAIHEVKNVASLSLSQGFMDQAYRYKMLADSMEVELHYWLTNSYPARVVEWLEQLGVIVHTGMPPG